MTSVFSKKIKTTRRKWIFDLSRNMTEDSKNILLHMINEHLGVVPKCAYCESSLVQKDLNGNEYNKYCSNCTTDHAWVKTLTPEQQKKRGEKISISKKEFYKTDIGKQVAAVIGNKNRIKMVEFNATEQGKKNIENSKVRNRKIMLEKISTGEFTPPITNSYTHWDAVVETNEGLHKFRSSWEACFWLCNKHMLHEKIRIPYKDDHNVLRTYIADFYDEKTNTLYELKPKSQWNKANHKMQQIINYCLEKNIKFIWINEFNIMQYIDEREFVSETNVKQLNKLLKGISKCNR